MISRPAIFRAASLQTVLPAGISFIHITPLLNATCECDIEEQTVEYSKRGKNERKRQATRGGHRDTTVHTRTKA